ARRAGGRPRAGGGGGGGRPTGATPPCTGWPSATASPGSPPTGGAWPPTPRATRSWSPPPTPPARPPPPAPPPRAPASRPPPRHGGAWLMVAHCWRFHPDVRALRARVEAGELGEIVKTRGYGRHARRGASGWLTAPR